MKKFLFMATVLTTMHSSMACAQTQKTELTGIWNLSDSKLEIQQYGSRVQARIATIGTDLQKRGFHVRDLLLYGNFDGQTLTGKLQAHSSNFREDRIRCPAEWIQWENITVTLSIDGAKLEGPYDAKALDLQNCSVASLPTELLSLAREPNDIVESAGSHPTVEGFNSNEQPVGIWLRPECSSALPGETISVAVGLFGKTAPRVVADRDYAINFKATNGEILSDNVTIFKNAASANVFVKAIRPGIMDLEATSSDHLQNAQLREPTCNQGGTIDKFVLQNFDQIVPTGTVKTAHLLVTFVDEQGVFVTGERGDKSLGWNHSGVGTWAMSTLEGEHIGQLAAVPSGECGINAELASSEEGKEVLIVSFRKQSEARSFKFYQRITPSILMFIALMSGLGTLVRTFQMLSRRKNRNAKKSKLRRILSIVGEYFVGAIGAILLYLSYYYGLLKSFVIFPDGWGMALLFAIVGGYLGATAVDRISRAILKSFLQQRRAKRIGAPHNNNSFT